MPQTSSDKLNAQYLAQLLHRHGCQRIVIAPGSRNAPLLIAFSAQSEYSCYSVPDERTAAFTAMGMCLADRKPTAVICSSGSAVANFYPAVVEAYYQQLPLLLITADRPKELIDQGVGQSIRQENLFEQHIAYSANLLRNPQDQLSKAYNQRLINEALLATAKGPVHINVPFDEPLYNITEELAPARFIGELKGERVLRPEKVNHLAQVWNDSPKIWVLAGQLLPNPELDQALDALNGQSPFLLFTETLSNLHSRSVIANIDRLINTLSTEQKRDLQPDLLVSIGGEVVSKMVKKYLRDFPPKAHWHVLEQGRFQDTYGVLTEHVQVHPALFFQALKAGVKRGDSSWRDRFMHLHEQRAQAHRAYLDQLTFTDFKAYELILNALPENSILHAANSTAVRYTQLFDHPAHLLHFSNRGTSGIDGCTSTALGHAMQTDKMVTLITGDVAFLYDSNAFWNDALPPNFRVIVINNGGGNIFRIIEGPTDEPRFERFQETVHQHDLSGIAQTFCLDFQRVDKMAELKLALNDFYAPADRPRVLEIQTPRLESPKALKTYFSALQEHL